MSSKALTLGAVVALCLSGFCAGAALVSMVHAWQSGRPPAGVLETCESYMTMMHDGRCVEAQALATVPGDAKFCATYGRNAATPRVSCFVGKHWGDAYATTGTLYGDGSYFRIVLQPRAGGWRVVNYDFLDED